MGVNYINILSTMRTDSNCIIFNISLRFTRNQEGILIDAWSHGSLPLPRDLRNPSRSYAHREEAVKERRAFFSKASYLERLEYNAFMSDYQRNFTSITRIQERCSSNHNRCLRFWQKLRLENRDELSGQPAHDWITQITTEWQVPRSFPSS